MLTTPDHADAVTSPAAPAPVGPTPSGFYQDCNEATGQEGTTFRAEDFNELIANLREVVFTSGTVTPTKGSATMLRAALHRLYAGAVHQVVATQTLSPDYAGLVIVDATSGNIDLTCPAAAACPQGSQAFTFIRIDSSTFTVRLLAGPGDVLVRGTLPLNAFDPLTLRSDGVLRWYVVSTAAVILRGAFTMNVSPTGSATPVSPLYGDAFQTIPQAMAYLNRFILAAGTVVVINVAAGTYVFTAPLDLSHPQAGQIGINGAGSATTILRFDGVDGLTANRDAPTIGRMTIRGNGGTGKNGVGVNTMIFDADIVVESWTGKGIVLQPNAYAILKAGQTLTVRNCQDNGIWISSSSFFEASSPNTWITLVGNGVTSGVQLECYGGLSLRALGTSGGAVALRVIGAGANASIYLMDVRDSTSPTTAVSVIYGAFLKAVDPNAPAGTWVFANTGNTVFYTLYCNLMSNVITWTNLAAGNRAATTPAVNTVGNAQSYIQAT
jgi:hypothetical protein